MDTQENGQSEVGEAADTKATAEAAQAAASEVAAPVARKELTDDEIRQGGYLVRQNHDTKMVEYLDQRGEVVAVRPAEHPVK